MATVIKLSALALPIRCANTKTPAFLTMIHSCVTRIVPI